MLFRWREGDVLLLDNVKRPPRTVTHYLAVTAGVPHLSVVECNRRGTYPLQVNAMHARMPSYSAPGERVILTALANPFTIPSRL